jgi:hypothetical protein
VKISGRHSYALNSKLFLIQRIKNQVHKDKLIKIAESLYISQLRYGLQLLGPVRLSDEDPINGQLKLWKTNY